MLDSRIAVEERYSDEEREFLAMVAAECAVTDHDLDNLERVGMYKVYVGVFLVYSSDVFAEAFAQLAHYKLRQHQGWENEESKIEMRCDRLLPTESLVLSCNWEKQ